MKKEDLIKILDQKIETENVKYSLSGNATIISIQNLQIRDKYKYVTDKEFISHDPNIWITPKKEMILQGWITEKITEKIKSKRTLVQNTEMVEKNAA